MALIQSPAPFVLRHAPCSPRPSPCSESGCLNKFLNQNFKFQINSILQITKSTNNEHRTPNTEQLNPCGIEISQADSKDFGLFGVVVVDELERYLKMKEVNIKLGIF